MPGSQLRGSDEDMRKSAAIKAVGSTEDELLPEYDFDYSRSKPNRFAGRMSKDCVAVVLEPDVAFVFNDAQAVNALLRSVIAALPPASRDTARGERRPNPALQPTPRPSRRRR